jgi:hypothetical protein
MVRLFIQYFQPAWIHLVLTLKMLASASFEEAVHKYKSQSNRIFIFKNSKQMATRSQTGV